MAVNWRYFPSSQQIPQHLRKVVSVFDALHPQFDSRTKNLQSNAVLVILRNDLVKVGFKIERGNKIKEKVHVPVLFGEKNVAIKSFNADGIDIKNHTVIEIEAGRGVTNYQFLKDFFEACVMYDIDYLIIAVRNIYRKHKNYEKVMAFFETLYASGRLSLPLKGILVIGY